MERHHGQQGFTLIELIVSVALFAVVMVIASATLLSLVYANRKAQALQSVINNLNVSLDGMVRNIREGQNYRCNTETYSSNYGDCASGGTVIYFTPFGYPPDGQNGNSQDDIAYAIGPIGTCPAGRICENEYGRGWIPITSPEIQIQSFTFYVVGTRPASQGGTQQPKAIFILKGQAGAQTNTISTFDIQASAVQRVLNL